MHNSTTRAARRFVSASAFALLAASACQAFAADAPAANARPEVEVKEVVVTATVGRAADAAPVKSSLKATEPQAVITRKFIEETAPRVGDYTTTAILAPSMSTIPNSNGPGATDGAKITLRGFQDGEFNVTYDGIAWGDTNGPSHHSNSFFPSSVIGGVVIDRGPGRASDLGQANFGGSVNLFSLPFEDQRTFRQTLTAGSFGTGQAVTTIATGPVAALHDANFVMNFMEYTTDGYLTNSPSDGQNQFFKGTVKLTPKITLTGLFTRNEDAYNQGDASSNATVAQTERYGKRFALSNDPTLATYKGYNRTKKQTDFEYIRLNADLGQGWNAENTVYSYFYSNRTLSANNNAADYTLDPLVAAPTVGPNLAAANKVILTPAATYPAGGSGYPSASKVNGLPGYTKRNAYRVIGDIVKVSKDFDIGKLTFGVEYENARTQRGRFDFDLLTGLPDYREKAALYTGPSPCGSLPVQTTPGKTWTGACQEPLNIAYSEYSGWDQYQPFAEFDWHVTDKLTITPGVKYVNFTLHVHAPALAIKGSIQPSYQEDTFTKTLPFLTANYRFQPNWSFYGQYAQGFLVPSISSFYVNLPGNNHVVPQESTNYQLGTVYSAGQFTFDGDVYYIDFKHKIQSIVDIPTGETYTTNNGGATYKGIEVQGTYLFPYGFSTYANYSANQATGNGNTVDTGGNGKQLAKVPRWTAALGLRYEHKGLFSSDDSVNTNVSTKWIGQQFATAASGAAAPTGLIPSFTETNWSTTYRYGHYSLEAQVLNLFDAKDITSFKGSVLIPGTNLPATSTALNPAAGPNVFTYQTGRSFQVTLKAVF